MWSLPPRYVYALHPIHVDSTFNVQKGHVLRVVFSCRRCQRKRSWSSSRVFANHYLVNQKYVMIVFSHVLLDVLVFTVSLKAGTH